MTQTDQQSRLAGMLIEIDRIVAEHSHPGWDGYNAKAILPMTGEHAKAFAAMVPGDVSTPDVIPESDGDISFDWNPGGEFTVSASISCDGKMAFSAILTSGEVNGTLVLTEANAGIVFRAVRLLENSLDREGRIKCQTQQ